MNGLGKEAKKLGTKACLVSYKDLMFLEPLMERITKLLEAEGVEVVPFFEIEANPEISMLERGVQLCREQGVDFVIGAGGGSAMDGAKIIAAGVNYKEELWNMVFSRHDGGGKSTPPTESLPTLMIPTLPATGSEMNNCAVASNAKLKEKSYAWSPHLFPTLSIIDPELTLTLPPFQTACAAADTISHVLEIYFNGEDDSDLQHYFQEGVMRTVIDNVGKVLVEPSNITARAHLQWTATCALNGWASPGDGWTPIHQVGHVLTSLYGVSHGASLAMLMPAWMQAFWSRKPQQYYRFAKNVMQVETSGKSEESVILEGIAKFKSFLGEIGAPISISSASITEAEFTKIVDGVAKVSFGSDGYLACNPPVSREDIMGVLKLAL